MKIHIHATCWNEIRMLPFFFRHYDPIVERYFIYDNGSDDGSLDYLRRHPKVTVEPLELPGDSLIEAAFERVNTLWWPSRGLADWVVVCNVDELFWHPDIWSYLRTCRSQGITFHQAVGYQMIADDFPAPDADLTETIRFGARFERMDKPAFFNPDAITESGFGMARHTCAPLGHVVRPDNDDIRLLHYKHLGLRYVLERHRELDARRRARDVEQSYGYHYSEDVTRSRHQLYLDTAEELFTLADAKLARARLAARR